MDVEGIDPVAVYAALMATLVRTVFAQPDPAWPGPSTPGSWTSSPSASRPRPNCWPTPPLTCWHSRHFPRRLAPDQGQQSQERLNSELAERVYRPGVRSCSRITSGPGSSRFPLWASVTTSRTSIAPQPGTQEIASSNYLSVLVFVHFIKLALTIGIESSFQILEIRSQWLHYLAPAAGVFRSDTVIVIFGQVPGATSASVWQSDTNPVVGDRGEGDHIAALCCWSGLALPGDALTPAPGAWPSPCSLRDLVVVCRHGDRVAVDLGIPEQLVADHGLELIIGHESCSLGGLLRPGRAQARSASRPSSWSAGSRPACIGTITDPLRKGPEIDGQVGGSAADHN
jgi:hypothetical protein